MLGDRPLIGGGGSGLVFKGEHEGEAVALNVLHKTRKNVVRRPSISFYFTFHFDLSRISVVKR